MEKMKFFLLLEDIISAIDHVCIPIMIADNNFYFILYYYY